MTGKEIFSFILTQPTTRRASLRFLLLSNSNRCPSYCRRLPPPGSIISLDTEVLASLLFLPQFWLWLTPSPEPGGSGGEGGKPMQATRAHFRLWAPEGRAHALDATLERLTSAPTVPCEPNHGSH